MEDLFFIIKSSISFYKYIMKYIIEGFDFNDAL
nr:MAG TPA: hypothetical protein [Caudoviricetes sp.]